MQSQPIYHTNKASLVVFYLSQSMILCDRRVQVKYLKIMVEIINIATTLFTGHSNDIWVSRPYHFKFFKGCLPQILLGPFLNTLTHIVIFFRRHCKMLIKEVRGFVHVDNLHKECWTIKSRCTQQLFTQGRNSFRCHDSSSSMMSLASIYRDAMYF